MSKYTLPASLLVLYSISLIHVINGQMYNETKKVFDDILSSSRYHTDVRPLLDQSQIINVIVNFQLVSIVDVNDVSQSFVCNAFIGLGWYDETLTWDVNDYGGTFIIHPHPKTIWRPRMVLLNTLDKRDLFEDDASPLGVTYDGAVFWTPGGLFKSSCDLNLRKYPFDVQTCSIKMLPMGLDASELLFRAGGYGLDFYSTNGEWILKGMNVSTYPASVSGIYLSLVDVKFTIERRSTFFVLNIILPVVLLSLLNMLVFTIPADSGEKVGYGITVVLAMSVFLSIVSGMLPRSADIVPNVTIYLFILLVVSVLTVIDAIVIVYFYHQEEKEDRNRKISVKYSDAKNKIGAMRRAMIALKSTNNIGPQPLGLTQHSSMSRERPRAHQNVFAKSTSFPNGLGKGNLGQESAMDDVFNEKCGDKPRINKYKIIGKYIDGVSLIVFLLVWLIVTLWYFISVMT